MSASAPTRTSPLASYLAEFEASERRAASAPAWLRDLRRAAMARFEEVRFPTVREEDWKYTNVAPIAETPFGLARGDQGCVTERDIARFPVDGSDGARLVFVNGAFQAALSDTRELPKGVTAGSLAEALAGDPPPHLGRYAAYQTSGFTALNTAFLRDAAYIELAAGAVVEPAIHVLYFSTADEGPTVSHPRTLVIAGRGSAATIVEAYRGLTDGTYFTNAVTEMVLGDGAAIDHVRLAQEGARTYHVGRTEVSQGRDSALSSFCWSAGGALVRHDLRVALAAEGAGCALNGLYLATGAQHVDNHTAIDHQKPHGSSRQLYKGVLDGRGRAVFNGKIFVRPDAQKTDAQQTNKNLLLSQDATVDTKPQLEILADDVKCTHGATVGQLDPAMVFYLKSRGLGLDAARALLTYGFAADVIERVKVSGIRSRLQDALRGALSVGATRGPEVDR